MNENEVKPEYVFWKGPARLLAGSLESDVNCRVFLPSSNKDIRIGIDDQLGFDAFRLLFEHTVWIQIAGIAERIQVVLSQGNINSQGHNVLTFGLLRHPLWFVKSEMLSSGRTELINFAHYRVIGAGHPRFELRACGWKAEFIPILDGSLAVSGSMHSDDHRLTHQVEFAREDKALFTAGEGQEYLEKLSLFLSFCRGRWVGTSFTVGLDPDGESVLEQWGTGRVSSWAEPSSWLDQHHGTAIGELFQSFLEKLGDQSWKDALSHVVYWFTRAETDNVGPDGACILLQATLERFAWHLLVGERAALSEKGFRDLTAADNIRLMLNILSIPAQVPVGLVNLGAYAKARNLDGPGVFTTIRNGLVHPPKSTAREKVPYYEAYVLAKWYVELAVLSACGYVGEYSNRTLVDRWVGQVERVPWA